MRNLFFKKSNPVTEAQENSSIQEHLNNKSDKLIDDILIESESRYRRLFETAHDGILILDFETGRITDANPFIINIIDYPLKDILGKELWEIGLFSNKEQSENAFTELKTNGYIRFEDMPIQRRSGKITEVEFISNVYKVNNTKVIQCNIRDITDRKRADEALIHSESRYRRLFETAYDGILILDFETGRITDANPFIINIIDYPLKDILGKELWEIGLFSNKEQSENAFTELKTNGYIRFEDMPIQRRSGKITEVEFISNVYKVNNTKVIQCNIRDITERKMNEKALKESEKNLKKQNTEYQNLNKKYSTLNEELTLSLNHIQHINAELISSKIKAEESDNLKTAFLTNMSHEIRTPMNAIVGFAGLLLEPGITHEKIKDFVRIINYSSQQLLSVISDIIDISKIETGQITIDKELVEVNQLMNELFETYKKLVDPEKLSLYNSSQRPNDLVRINTDGNRIKQIFCNLLNNSLKFTHKGEIEFGYKLQEGFIEFYVKDSGVGITPVNQEIIFQRFRQAEEPNNLINKGNGLGLSISKALVEKLGGTIMVDSEYGKGSTFTFIIPVIKANESSVKSEIVINSETFSNWDKKSILIVEDEVNSHEYIKALLSATQVKMFHAWNGKDAVDTVKNHADISLVLMDIKMPVMNGYEALKHIKQIRPKLPVIAQTAYALSHDKAKALHAGFDSYISKPIPKGALVQIIAGYLS